MDPLSRPSAPGTKISMSEGQPEDDIPAYRIVGITNSAPARMPVGQRAVTVFSRV